MNAIKKLIPKSLLLYYHKIVALIAGVFYGWPSKKMVVIGVTGTNGKTTTTEMVAYLLEKAGNKVGMISTVNIQIADEKHLNRTKMTMFGRFKGQKLLSAMHKKGCKYAVIEVSSEGILQSRHRSIDFDVGVFTNLSREHLDAHGGYENYRKAKEQLFCTLEKKKKKIDGSEIEKIAIVNGDDAEAEHFLKYQADKKVVVSIENSVDNVGDNELFKVNNIEKQEGGCKFSINNVQFNLGLIGKYNIYNTACALVACKSLGVDLNNLSDLLKEFKGVAGRMEVIDEGQPFNVIVDYAHTPDSFEKIFPDIKELYPDSRIIAAFGSAGGVRDVEKRPKLGRIAAEFCDKIIVCNEDPWDTPPEVVVNDIVKGIEESGKVLGKDYEKIEDRKEAIKKALSLAEKNDVVLVLGKGTEQFIAIGKEKIPWDDREVVRELLRDVKR